MDITNDITILSANCQGLRNMKKRIDVLNYYKERNIDILCLQDTHLLDSDEKEIKNIWDGNFIINGKNSNSRGTAIFLVTILSMKLKKHIKIMKETSF